MANFPHHPVLGTNQNLSDIVKDYFKKGYTYLERLEFKKLISLSTFKRYMKKMNCFHFGLLPNFLF